MVNLDDIKSLYFIGVGGIGMSALARYFSFHGKSVSGYDRTETFLTRQLVNEGINVIYSDAAELAPKDADLVVYTPAVPTAHPQLNYYRSAGYALMKRSEVLGAITRSTFNICVAGTHGKTTVSTMVAHILRHSGYGCNAFLGGIAANYNSNFWSNERSVCVVEADEFDRSFLHLTPDVAVVTAADPDHLDIYGTEESVRDAFVAFTGKIKPGGMLFSKKGLTIETRFNTKKRLTYSLKDQQADVYSRNVKLLNGYYVFDVQLQHQVIDEVALNMGGLHNVENATVAIAIASELGIESDAIRNAVEEFKGVKRRFEYIVKKKNVVYIDDYAHHPEELATLISSAKDLFPHLKCLVVFQPHLYTRTRDFAEGFAHSLDLADEVILLPVYAARESPIDGVESLMLATKMRKAKVFVADKQEALAILNKDIRENDEHLIITAGAGDIDTMVDDIKNLLNAKK